MEVNRTEGVVVNSKGQTYYFHKKDIEGKPWLKLTYFSKDATGKLAIPDDMEVFENSRTGLPMVRKKK